MDPRQKKNRPEQSEAGPSSSFHARNRNDQYTQRPSNRDVIAGGQNKWNNQPKRWYPKDDRDGRQFKANYQKRSSSNSLSSESSLSLIESGKSKPYICPNCKHPYNYFVSNNTISGKVPKILPCKHTVCEECIKRCLKTTNHIQCSICLKTVSNKKQIFEYNHYVLGHLTCSRFNRFILDSSTIALVSSESRSRSNLISVTVSTDQKEKCGFKDCLNLGTVSCVNCCGVYCDNCDAALHGSGKQLMLHKRVSIKNATFELNKCSDHSMFEDIYCYDCQKTSCCYCVLEKHEGHSRTYLGRLTKEEEKDLVDICEKAKLKRNQLLISQEKISKIDQTEVESELDIEISQKFADIHAQLFFIEKKLHEDAKLLKNGQSNLMELYETIKADIERLNYMIRCVDERGTVMLNLKMLLNKFKEMENLPTVLVSREGSIEPKLVIDEQIYCLDTLFKIEVPDKVTFSLMELDELPQEYQEKMELPEVKSTQSKTSGDSDICKNVKENLKTKDFDIFKQVPVFLTHINSLESFYVQFKEEDHLFQQLEQEINNHVGRMRIGVSTVELKELYLARRVCDTQKWCRVRVLEAVEDEYKYDIKFIDFGNTAVVSKDEMMYVSSSIAKKRPFAYECRLYNPSSFKWLKDTHLELAKLLDVNKELVMYTKEHLNNIFTVELNINTSTGGLCSVTDLLIFGCDALKKKPITETHLLNSIYDNSDVYVVGKSYEVYIRYILDLWHVYVQSISYESIFNNLIKHMEDFYNNSRCDIHLPIKNSYVVIYHQIQGFGNWHRARILDVFENKKSVNVCLIDLGNRLNVSWKDTRKLAQIFKKSECLVVCTKLADVAPLITDSWSNADGSEAAKYLKNYSKRTQRMKMLVSNSDPLEVVLFEPLETYDININALLVEEELVLSTGKFTGTKIWIHKDEVQTEENNILFFKDDSDDEEIEDEIQGLKLQVEVVQFENPSSFYVSFVGKKKIAEKLHEELQIHFKSQKYYKNYENWKVNDKVVVFDSSDKMYYRGIINTIDGNEYSVDFLDRPDYLWVDSGKLRSIPSYFANNFPNTVFKCHLANIKPAGDSNKWSNLSVEWFEILFKKYDHICIKKIEDDTSKSSIPVTMWYSKIVQGTALEPSYRNYVSIDKKVVKAGLAFWVSNEVSRSHLHVTDEPTTSKQIDSNLNGDNKLSDTNETSDSAKTVVPKPSREIRTNSIKQWLPALKLTTNEFFAYITCAENEGYLFIREENMQNVYEEMEKKIKQHFNTIPKAGNFTLRENQMVMIHSKGCWYRGVVLAIIDENTAQVMMVDFGSDHVVKLTNLHNKIMYPEIPIMVSRVKLFNIQSKSKTWTDFEVEILVNTAPEYGKFIIRSSLNDMIPLADVYDINGICLNDKLVELCPNLSRSKSMDLVDQSMLQHKDELLKSLKSADLVDQIVLKHLGETDSDFKYIGSISNMDEECEVQPKIEETTVVPKIEVTVEQEETIEVTDDHIDDNAELIKEVIQEVSTAIEEQESVLPCIQLPLLSRDYTYATIEQKILEMDIIAVYDYKTISLYNPDDNSTEEDFEALTNCIRSNVATLQFLDHIDIELGLPCISLFEEDNQWYRAKIIRKDAQQCGYVTVIYVDYGNIEVVKLSNLRTMRPEWLHFPARFIEASIAYILLKKDQENVLLKHIQSLAGETKYIEFVENYPTRLVHVHNKINNTFDLYYDAFLKNGIVAI